MKVWIDSPMPWNAGISESMENITVIIGTTANQRGVGQRRRAVGSLVGDEAMSEEASELDPIVEMFAHALSCEVAPVLRLSGAVLRADGFSPGRRGG
ncbi:hypothetical protein ACPA9J_11595 [Pseudomonas aeruginosa]